MSPTAAQRAIADVVLAERLSVGMYGELYRAHGAERRELRALIVDSRLLADAAFAAQLVATPSALRGLRHRGVVTTVAVSRADDGKVVVVTEPVSGPVALHDVLADVRGRGSKVSRRIAAAIARGVVDALVAAHGAGVIHGAVHPRSVDIDVDGVIKLGDFAVARALILATARGGDPSLARGLNGYLAPELAGGDEPTPAADVFAVGAMIFAMLTGEPPLGGPGTMGQTPAIERLVQRALDVDLGRRFPSAVELQENLLEALEDDGWEVASASEVARFVGDSRSSAEANLDAATEDLLASLGEVAKEPPTRRNATPVPVGAPVTATTRGLDELLADLGDGTDVGSEPGSEVGDDALTDVDPGHRQAGRDPISELLDLEDSGPTHVAPDGGRRPVTRIRRGASSSPPTRPSGSISHDQRSDPTPLPVPRPDETQTFAGADMLSGRRIGIATAENQALAAIADLDVESKATTQMPALPMPAPSAPMARRGTAPQGTPLPRRAPAVPEPDVTAPVHLRRRSLGWLWALLIVGGVGALVWVVMTQTDLIRRAAKDSEAARQRAAAETERLTAELPDPGSIRVGSSPDGAAVWLLLGRAPMTSLALPTGMVHQLRVDLDGHRAVDRNVTGADWTGTGDARVASLTVALQPGTAALPALPPAPPAAASQGLAAGRGTIRVESTPAGAAVWLLVGVTGSMELAGIEAGRDYDLRVQKDGFLPGYLRVTAEEWRAGGDPRLPLSAAPKKATIERRVDLVAAPGRGK